MLAAAMANDTRPHPHRLASTLAIATALLALAGCGAEVAGGAAVVGGMQAQQATQAQQQQAQVVQGLKAAQDAGLARAASAAD
jgi:hypothetical protein